jgi:uncharacterized protein (TIGR02646 family)
MLFVPDRALTKPTLSTLAKLQRGVDGSLDYPAKVAAAKSAWDGKTSTAAKRAAFFEVRTSLAAMCVGPIRCAYCEDSLADEIEHIRPKSLFPEITFSWANYLFSCGPCNGPKSSRYGILVGNVIQEFVRRRGDEVIPPPAGISALIDPRIENPMDFLDLDMGGVTPQGVVVGGTFDFLPRDDIADAAAARAAFTIDVLGLNREVMRVARQNAFSGFRARLREYVAEREAGAGPGHLDQLRAGLLTTPHLTVFAEMRRQRPFLPEIDDLFHRAPEASLWPLVPVP